MKEIEFNITCYLSDVSAIETFLHNAAEFSLLGNLEFEQFTVQRDINDPEVPVGYWVKAELNPVNSTNIVESQNHLEWFS